MPMDLSTTNCEVEITTPTGETLLFPSSAPQSALIRVETHKDMQQACGSFRLVFAPVRSKGLTWDQRIPLRSLVQIRMERTFDKELPNVNSTVMVGLTDDHGMSEDYRQANFTRAVVVSGRELSAIMIDAQLWFHQALEGKPYMLSVMEAAQKEGGRGGLLQLMLTWNPALSGPGMSPQDILRNILSYYLLGGGAPSTANEKGTLKREGLINLQLPSKLALSEMLQMNYAAWNTFEPNIKVAIANSHPYVGSIWNYLHVFIDGTFQEFFSRIEDGVCKLHFRGKPFKHEPVTTGSRFLESEKTLQTMRLLPTWLLSANLHFTSQTVYNVFWVQPMNMGLFMDSATLRLQIPPEVVENSQDVSYVGRYGLRLMEVSSPYLSVLTPKGGKDVPTGNPLAKSTQVQFPTEPPPAMAPIPVTVRIPTESLRIQQSQYAQVGAQIAQEEGIPAEMVPAFLANLQTESDFDPLATGKMTKYGQAKGIGQLIDSTAQHYGVTDPYDPVQSMRGAARYWRDLTKQFGRRPDLVAAAYNWGPKNLESAGRDLALAPDETKKHVALVTVRTQKFVAPGSEASLPQVPAPAVPSTSSAPPVNEVAGSNVGEIALMARRWSKILRAWYDSGPVLAIGSMVVRGHPAWNIGHRLLYRDERDEREFYIEGVSHTYEMRTGLYLTQLRVTRGWYLGPKPGPH